MTVDARPGKVRERTCIGCRKRDSPSGLLRMTVSERQVLPDPEHRAPGRGAHLHPVTGCLDLAERRKAFPRAFRVQGPLDTSAVRNWIEGSGAGQRSSAISRSSATSKASAATRPPEAVEGSSRRHEGGSSTHDHSMSVER